MDLISGLARPRMIPGQVDATGVQAPSRPVSRAATFEDFLGNFIGALGKGFEASGHGPGAFARGFGGAVGAPLAMQQQQQQFAQQQATGQANLEDIQAQTAPRQRQTELAGSMVTVSTPAGPITLPYAAAVQGGFLKGGLAAQATAAAKRYINTPGVGLVDTQAKGGPQVVVPNKSGGVAITDDLATQYNIPSDFVGQNIDLKTLATLEKLGPTTSTKLTRDPVTGLVTSSTTTTTRGAGPSPSGFPRPSAPAPRTGGSVPASGTTKWDPSSTPVQLVEGQLDPAQLSKRGSTYNYYLEQADRYSREKYGKPFDAGQASIDYNYARNPQTQNTLRMINGMTEKGGAIEIAQNAAKSLPQFDSATANKIFNATETEFGSASATNFHTAMLGLADEYSKVMGGGVSSDTGRQQALDLLKQSYSKGRLSGAIGIMQKDLAARQEALIAGNRYLQRQFGGQRTPTATGNDKIDSLVEKYGRQ